MLCPSEERKLDVTKVHEATATQIRNIESATGRSLDEWIAVVYASGLDKHGQIVSHLKSEHGFRHGNANLVAAKAREALAGGPVSADDLLAAQYSGAKAELRPIHDLLVDAATAFGDDVEVVTQKTAVSLRSDTQFGVIRPASSTRVELGLNLGDTEPTGRLRRAGGMCSHRVDIGSLDDIDDELLVSLELAYRSSIRS
jgi:hypothetical protein